MEPIKNTFSLKTNKSNIIEGFSLGIKIFHYFFFQKSSVVIPLALMKVLLPLTWLFFQLLTSFIFLFTACFFLHYFMHSNYGSIGSFVFLKMVGTSRRNLFCYLDTKSLRHANCLLASVFCHVSSRKGQGTAIRFNYGGTVHLTSL